MEKTIRIHDDFYLNEKRYQNPKQSFIRLFEIIGKKKFKNKTILDIGCANGELIYNLLKKYPAAHLTGCDINDKLLKLCKRKFNSQNVNFLKLDISKKFKVKQKFDIIIMSGVISIFDDCKQILNNIFNLINKNGLIFIFNHFNEYPIEVMIKYKTHDKFNKYLQSGWNIHSLYQIEKICKKKNFKLQKFKFIPKKGFGRKLDDPLRSWTFKDSSGKNIITTGINIIQNQYWLKIRKK